VELSGLIFVALALVWAVVLIPKALRHHDEAAETRSVDNPTARASAHSVGDLDLVARRGAAATAARRRRRMLGVLLVTTAGIAAASWLGYLLSWAPAVPGLAIVVFVVVSRITVRRDQSRWNALVASRAAAASAVEQTVEEVHDAEVPAEEMRAGEAAPARQMAQAEPVATPHQRRLDAVIRLDDTSSLPVGLPGLEPTIDPGSLWDPLPVTLPTYVGKPRATRSVRTIDLNTSGVASSGRDAAASALVAEAATAAPEPSGRRAVGS
jgi:hypothetical protein